MSDGRREGALGEPRRGAARIDAAAKPAATPTGSPSSSSPRPGRRPTSSCSPGLGVTDVAENRDQEARPKHDACAVLGLRWHFVGQLQRNKARFPWRRTPTSWSRSTGPSWSRRSTALAPAGRALDVLLRSTCSSRPTRTAAAALHADLGRLADLVAGAEALRLHGLMAVAPAGEDPAAAFARLADAAAALRADHPEATVLSAGMSHDLSRRWRRARHTSDRDRGARRACRPRVAFRRGRDRSGRRSARPRRSRHGRDAQDGGLPGPGRDDALEYVDDDADYADPRATSRHEPQGLQTRSRGSRSRPAPRRARSSTTPPRAATSPPTPPSADVRHEVRPADRSRWRPLHRATLHPRSYNDARRIGGEFRDGVPVIMNLSDMDDAEAKRLVDFAAGLIFGCRGSIDASPTRCSCSPRNVDVAAEAHRLAQDGFFNQS